MKTAGERSYAVPDVSCEHCRTAIEGAVGQLVGVDRVTVDLTAKRVDVVGAASDPAIRAAIEEAGYEVGD